MLFHRKNTLSASVFRIVCAALILGLSLVFLHFQHSDQAEEQYDIHVVPPTCTENGYSLYTDQTTKEVFVNDITEANGHRFGQWALERAPEGILCGTSSRTCSACSLTETRAEYPDLPLSRISLYGSLEGIGKKSEVPLTAHLSLKDDALSLDCYATLKYQGHVSLSYDKKNYTLKLFQDEARKEKYKLTLSHWNKENKYILKANHIDTSQCRNLVCADIWADICASRAQLPHQLPQLSNYGAVDGFPVVLYVNDQFFGLYDLNLHKDDDLFCMEEGQNHAIMICNHSGDPEAFFASQAAFTEDSPWEVEFCGTSDSTWAKEKLNAFIDFVMTSSDHTFRTELPKYLDTDAAIDYLITLYALGLTNHKSQDLVLVSYGDVWIPSLYDMETAFGLWENGTSWSEPDVFLPQKANGSWDSGTGNLLWDRLLQNFSSEIAVRYQELRHNILAPENLCKRAEAFMNEIPLFLYDAEDQTNPHPLSFEQHKAQILQYIPQRIAALDHLFS